jgi:hypothetical protein
MHEHHTPMALSRLDLLVWARIAWPFNGSTRRVCVGDMHMHMRMHMALIAGGYRCSVV